MFIPINGATVHYNIMEWFVLLCCKVIGLELWRWWVVVSS